MEVNAPSQAHDQTIRSCTVISNDYRWLVHTPADLAVQFVEYTKQRKHYNGVTWGVPSMDKVIIPMHPGDVTGVIARPGHGKSTLCAYLARYTGKRIMQ